MDKSFHPNCQKKVHKLSISCKTSIIAKYYSFLSRKSILHYLIKFKLGKNIFNAPENFQELGLKLSHQLKLGTNFNFHPLRKSTG